MSAESLRQRVLERSAQDGPEDFGPITTKEVRLLLDIVENAFRVPHLDEPCSYDHDGFCQTHLSGDLVDGVPCAIQALRSDRDAFEAMP